MEAEKREMEEADTVSALASLSVGGEPQHRYVRWFNLPAILNNYRQIIINSRVVVGSVVV